MRICVWGVLTRSQWSLWGVYSLFNYLSQIGTPNLLFLMDTSVPQGSDEISILLIYIPKKNGLQLSAMLCKLIYQCDSKCVVKSRFLIMHKILPTKSHIVNTNEVIILYKSTQMCPKYLVSAASDGSSFIWATLGVGTGDLLYFDSFNI